MNKIQKIRLVVFGAIAAFALVIVLFGAPTQDVSAPVDGLDWDAVASSINTRNSANNRNASGAPQQTVVNGWTTIDWLETISEQLHILPQQNSTIHTDNRVPFLLVLLVVGACFEWATKDIKTDENTVVKETVEEQQ